MDVGGNAYRRWGGGEDGFAVDLLVIGAEGLVVHVPDKHITTIGVRCDGEVLGYGRVGSCWEGEDWSRQGEIVLSNVSGFALWDQEELIHCRICYHRRG